MSKSLKDSAKPDCVICNGSGQDTRITGFTGVCECVSYSAAEGMEGKQEESQDELWMELFHILADDKDTALDTKTKIKSKYTITRK